MEKVITTDFTEIQKIIKGGYEQLYAPKMEPRRNGYIPDTDNLLRLNSGETEK